jgi:dTDP-4-amino-4,6-dideoxygalactose transaminase
MPGEQRLSWSLLRLRGRAAPLRTERAGERRYELLWARNALYHGLAALKLVPGDRVLLPAYICAAAVEPFLAYGVTVAFYDVGRDCRPVLADLEARIDGRTRAVMWVHYFGFPQSPSVARRICDRHGLFLIEDCAHVLPDGSDDLQMGRVGDVAAFSWRKFLPIGDGAELVVKGSDRHIRIPWARESPLVTLKVINDLGHQIAGESRSAVVRAMYRGLQAPKQLLRRRVSRTLVPQEDNQEPFKAEMVNFPMTRASRWVLRHSDIEAIRARRRENYRFLLEALAGSGGVILPFPELPAGVCPWVLPVFVEGLANPHWRLRARGIPAVSWGGVRHAGIPRGPFPGADCLYENLIFLPVHQSLEGRDLSLIVDGMKELLSGRAGVGRPGR